MSQRYDRELSEFEGVLKAKGYQPLDPFFVLYEKEIPDERTGGTVKLTRERLENIAAIQNERIATTGDATPIIIGHTKRHLPENQQPPITGLATRYEVAPFYKTGKYGIKATPWAKAEDKINFTKYPRRSCELWTDPDLIDPISLLGANTPRLDLGLHLSRPTGYRPRTPLTLEMGDDMPEEPDTDKPADKGNVDAAAGTQTDKFAQLQAQVAELMQMKDMLAPLLAELGGGPGGGDMGGMGGPPGAPPMGMGGPPPGGGAPPMGGPPPAPMQAAATPPGGMNSMMPQQFGRDALQFQHVGYGQDGRPLFTTVQPPAPPAFQTQYPPVQQPLQFGQQGGPVFTPPVPTGSPNEVEQLRVQVASLQLARMNDEVTLILNDLSQKIVVDRAVDHANLIKLDPKQRNEAIQFMLNTRRSVEPALPPEGLPLQFHAQPPAAQQQAEPVQLGMGVGQTLSLPGDPALSKPGGGKPANVHDALMEVVRNRGKLSPMQAFEAALGSVNNGKPQVPVR